MLGEKIGTVHSQDRRQEEVLAEIEKLNGQTAVLSEPIKPQRFYKLPGALCLLSCVATEMNAYKHEALLPIAEKLVAAGADVKQLSEPFLPRSMDWCVPRSRYQNDGDTANYPRLSPLACCFAFSEQPRDDRTDGCLKFAKLMVKSGVDLKKDPNAFVFACLRYDIDLVEYLLENGADANSKLPNGMPVILVLAGFHSKNCYIAANAENSGDEYRLGRRKRFIKLVRLLLEARHRPLCFCFHTRRFLLLRFHFSPLLSLLGTWL